MAVSCCWCRGMGREYAKRKFGEIQETSKLGRKGWQKDKERKKKPKWAR